MEEETTTNFLSLNEASEWASNFLGKEIKPTNIQYLLQYAKLKKYFFKHAVAIKLNDLKNYYLRFLKQQEYWRNKLGADLDWSLSFDNLKESDTTKHVHRLHPYKGKFIPQLVEYFLDGHLNTHKKEIFFKKGDTILDPFMGSGTTLVQASELGLNSIGIDVSDFNCLISNVKLDDYNLSQLSISLNDTLSKIINFSNKTFNNSFDLELKYRLAEFNQEFFYSQEFKTKIIKKEIEEFAYGREKLEQFFKKNESFFKENGTKDKSNLFNESEMNSFISKWFTKRIRQELFYYVRLIESVKDSQLKKVMKIILSRTARSCRATTHSDLATLKEPQINPYYCRKHKKLCTPVNSILKHLIKNTYDTIERLKEFSQLKKNTFFSVIHADSRQVDILEEIKQKNKLFHNLLNEKKIDGIFTSPPYVGQIDYHEQHAYAYELFDIKREDENEIGPLFKGQSNKAKEDYVEGISKVFQNILRFVKDDGNFFIVANDKYNLYPIIAEKSGLIIIDKFKRPVLNRTERDRQPYAEIIFHMKKK